MSWRPDNWEERKQVIGDEVLNQDDYMDRLYEAGADAYASAVDKLLLKNGLQITPEGHLVEVDTPAEE